MSVFVVGATHPGDSRDVSFEGEQDVVAACH